MIFSILRIAGFSIGGATLGPAGAQAPAENAVPLLAPRLEKYWYFNIMSRLPECAPSQDHRAPAAVPRLVCDEQCSIFMNIFLIRLK